MSINTRTSSQDPTDAGTTWNVDAQASLQSVLDDPRCSPLLRQTLTGPLSWQTRNETPIRRALVAPRIAPQWIAALLALGALVTVEGEGGTRTIPLERLLQRQVEGEVATVHIPLAGPGQRWGESHVARTPADEPIVAAIAVVKVTDPPTVRQARVALTGVWQEAARLAEAPARLVGGPLDGPSIQTTAEAVGKESTPQGDFLGSAEYRRAMAVVSTRRALEQCQHQGTKDE